MNAELDKAYAEYASAYERTQGLSPLLKYLVASWCVGILVFVLRMTARVLHLDGAEAALGVLWTITLVLVIASAMAVASERIHTRRRCRQMEKALFTFGHRGTA